MSKVTLSDVGTLTDPTTATNTINVNSSRIEAAFDNTLSRDGRTPNYMGSSLDMNSNRILNLPEPVSVQEPVRLEDIQDLILSQSAGAVDSNVYGSVSAASLTNISGAVTAIRTNGYYAAGDGGGGLYYKVVAEPTHAGKIHSADGAWWELVDCPINIRQFGAVGNNAVDDTLSIQNAIDKAYGEGGGIVFVPHGDYSVISGIEVKSDVHLIGENRIATTIQAWHTDVLVCKMTGDRPVIENISFFGKGTNQDTGVFGATQNCLQVDSVDGVLRDCVVWGGNASLYLTGADNLIENVSAAESSYGTRAVDCSGANWFIRCKFDHQGSTITATSSQPYANWSALQAVTVGTVRITNGYSIICSKNGTTGAAAPTLKNYGLTITDGSATWELFGPSSYTALYFGQSCGENHCLQVDLSGTAFTQSMQVNVTAPFSNGPGITVFEQGVCSNVVNIVSATWVKLSGNEFGASVVLNTGFAGHAIVCDNYFTTANTCSLSTSTAISNFIFTGNDLNGGTIAVPAGASDGYAIANNVNCTVTNAGTGTNQSVKAVGVRGAKVDRNGSNVGYIPPSPNNFYQLPWTTIRFNQANFWSTSAFRPPNGSKLIYLDAQVLAISGVKASPGNWLIAWHRNPTFDGSNFFLTGTEILTGFGAVSGTGANSTIVRASGVVDHADGDYYIASVYIDSTSLGVDTVVIDGAASHSYATAAVLN